MTPQPADLGTLRLVLEGQVQADSSFPLPTDAETVLGREPDCDILLDAYGMVSRRHAAIRFVRSPAPDWLIQDLSSANGTFVNGERVQGERVLLHRDRIQLAQGGPEFQFESETGSPPRPTGQPVVTKQTIEERNYRIDISSTTLVIQRKNGGRSSWGFVGVLTVMGFFFPPLLFFAVIIALLSAFLLTWDTCYTFDLAADQLLVSRISLVSALLGRRRDRHYPLHELSAVRLQKSAYEGDEGTRYNDYAIFLDRETGKSLKLALNWRQSSANDQLQKAQEMVEVIEQFLTRS